ncbi:MAG: hypothetical protein NTY01_01300 [Verrucomicrobia bacterium]|nr:hypothetical protein [Verrucomicrobiota bacterium]
MKAMILAMGMWGLWLAACVGIAFGGLIGAVMMMVATGLVFKLDVSFRDAYLIVFLPGIIVVTLAFIIVEAFGSNFREAYIFPLACALSVVLVLGICWLLMRRAKISFWKACLIFLTWLCIGQAIGLFIRFIVKPIGKLLM